MVHNQRAREGDVIDALHTQHVESSAWRRDLKSKIAWTLAAKALALVLLWLLFFRGHAA